MTHIEKTPAPEDDPISQTTDAGGTRLTVKSLENIEALRGKQVIFHFPRNTTGPYTITDIHPCRGRWELTVLERPQKISIREETEIEIL